MKKYVLVMLALLIVAQSSEAATRRRMRRQSRRNSTTMNYARSTTNYAQPTGSNSWQSSPVVQPTMNYIEPTGSFAPTESIVVPQPGRVTYQKPVIDATTSNETLLAQGELPDVPELGTANSTTIPGVVVQAAATDPYCASCQVLAPSASPSYSALSELNGIRARRGLHPLVEDPALSAIAYRKASIQANRRVMYHPGGSMGGARFEGVGMGARFTTCYQDSRAATVAGAATVTGANGQRYHCLLLK